MEDDDDTDVVRSVAEDYVTRLGRDAVPYLRSEEAASERADDGLSAQAWHDIGNAAEQILVALKLTHWGIWPIAPQAYIDDMANYRHSGANGTSNGKG